MTLICAAWHVLVWPFREAVYRLIAWLDVDEGEQIPFECRTCREPLPFDPWMWERWEHEHERRHDAEALDEMMRRVW